MMLAKIVYGKQTVLHRIQNGTTFLQLTRVLSDHFEGVPAALHFQYEDADGDVVDILCDKDIQTLLDSDAHAVVITATPAHPKALPEETMLIEIEDSEPPESLREDRLPSPLSTHRAGCDNCKACPIRGIRFKCVICEEYNLCQRCEAQTVHREHPFLKLRTPQQLPTEVRVKLSKDRQEQEYALVASYLSETLAQEFDLCLEFVKKEQLWKKDAALQRWLQLNTHEKPQQWASRVWRQLKNEIWQ